MSYLYIFLGGGLGSLCRFGIAQLISSTTFPLATLIANIISCIILGCLIAYTANYASSIIKLVFMTGFCGGFSTYSTFTAETFRLLQEQAWGLACINIFGTLFCCLISIYVGLLLGKTLF